MSHQHNDTFLEHLREAFEEATERNQRGRIIENLRENGFKDEADYLLARWFAEREVFLEDNGLTEKDIFVDEYGQEYGIYYEENGTPGEEGYGFRKQIITIPDTISNIK